MSYSRAEYAFTGGAQDFVANFALGVLDVADVSVYVIGEVDGLGNQIFRDFTWRSSTEVRVTSALPNPCTVVVQRTVDKDTLEIDLGNTGAPTRETLVRAFKQVMMNIHELIDGRAEAFTGALLDAVNGIKDVCVSAMNTTIGYRDAAASSATAANDSADTAVQAASVAVNAANTAAAQVTASVNAGVASQISEAVAANSKALWVHNATGASLGTAAAVIAQVQFVASAADLHATASARFDTSTTSSGQVETAVRLIDVTTGGAVIRTHGTSEVVSSSSRPIANHSLVIAHDALVPGRTYRIELTARVVSLTTGSIWSVATIAGICA